MKTGCFGRPVAGLYGIPAPASSLPARHLPRHQFRLLRLRPANRPGRVHRGQQTCARAALEAIPEFQDRVYDAARNGAYWATRPVQVTKRTLQIGAAFSRWLLQSQLQKDTSSERLTGRQAETLRQVLTDLGPAFVKIGQAVSSRPDLVPPDYLRELERLQDQIPPFSNDDARALIEAELGAPLGSIFSELSDESIAAASLGQVYKGRLRRTGQAVAVKVQRPGVRESIALDIYIMRFLLQQVRKLRKVNSDLPALLDEWAGSLFRELDYTQEAANGVRFKKLYGHMEGVYVPEMYLDVTTERVLVMEWVDGVRLRSATQGHNARARLDDLALVEVGVRCSLEQMLEEGYYHSDPHPGNLFRTADGQLAYIDFGMMGEIQAPIRRGLIRATLHMVNREFGLLADDFMTLGLLPPGSDKSVIVPALTGVFERALENGVSNVSFGELSGGLGQTMYEFQFRIPPYYTLLVRSLSVLEGIAISSDPNYKVLGAAYPWIARRLLTDKSPELRDTLRTLLYKNNRFQFTRLESLLKQAVRSPAREYRPAAGNAAPAVPTSTSFGAALGSMQAQAPALAGSAASTARGNVIAVNGGQGQAPPANGQAGQTPQSGRALALLLSDEGEFVREIMVDELAKGLDAGWRLGLDNALATTKAQLLGLLGAAGRELDVRQGQYRGLPGSLLLESLMALPQLADEEDHEQIEGLSRLIRQLQAMTPGRASAPAPATTTATTAVGRAPGGITIGSAVTANRGGVATAGPGSPQQPFGGLLAVPPSVASALDMLRWVMEEAQTLPREARIEALRIPLALASKVSNRIIARTFRGLLGANVPGQTSVTGPNGYANGKQRARTTASSELADARAVSASSASMSASSSAPGSVAPVVGVSQATTDSVSGARMIPLAPLPAGSGISSPKMNPKPVAASSTRVLPAGAPASRAAATSAASARSAATGQQPPSAARRLDQTYMGSGRPAGTMATPRGMPVPPSELRSEPRAGQRGPAVSGAVSAYGQRQAPQGTRLPLPARQTDPAVAGMAGVAGAGSGHDNGAGGSVQAKSPRQVLLGPPSMSSIRSLYSEPSAQQVRRSFSGDDGGSRVVDTTAVTRPTASRQPDEQRAPVRDDSNRRTGASVRTGSEPVVEVLPPQPSNGSVPQKSPGNGVSKLAQPVTVVKR